MKTRVHELAREFGVESKWVLEKLKEMGEFVKSSSSVVSAPAEMWFRTAYGAQLAAGVKPASVERADKMSQAYPAALKAPRRTSWDDSPFDDAGRDLWMRHGLGEGDAKLAVYLLEHGLLPEDLSLIVRGRRAVSRLRGAEESRRVLVAEMLEVRPFGGPRSERVLPTKAMTRRRVEGR